MEKTMKHIAWILAAALAAPFAAHANEQLSYNYIEFNYLSINPDDFDSEDGFGLRGSAAISPNFHVFGGYENVDFSGFDLDTYRVGLGYNTPLNDTVDFVGRVAWENIDIGPIDDDGFSAEVGVRAAMGPSFEGGAAIRYVDFDNSTTSLVLNGQYKFNQNWGVNAEVDVNSDGQTFLIGPRLSF
jgi:Ax21 family sulfation-dependent quorum factor